MAPFGQITEEHFDKLIGVNMKGLLFTVQKALPLMGEGGSIILNSSVAGSTGVEAFSVYSATKAAVRSFARGWTSDLKKRKIRVNAISPGPIETPIFGKMACRKRSRRVLAITSSRDPPWAGSGGARKSPKRRSFWPPTTRAT
jgi:NAD(P)-dependent dehydrogenase (short-subunit alcohol dehydrogenase family)